MEEIWKEYKTQKTDIEVSNYGNIRGKKYFGIKFDESLITIKNGRRYLINYPIFRLVWLVFNGEKPKGYVVHHKDHNKLNDKLDNLVLMTIAEHASHHHTGMKMPKVTPTDTDRAMLREMLHAIEELEPRKKAGAYRQLLVKKKIIPSNQYEISSLIDILGLCGILSTAEHPCPDVEFRGCLGIDPPEIRSDIAYPVCWWRAGDGINPERFRKVFGFDYREL